MAAADDVRKLAALARLRVSDEELAGFTKEFEGILAYVGKLDELALEIGRPSAGAVRNVLREDGEPHTPGVHAEALAGQFPRRAGNHLAVKQIISYD